MNLLVLTLAVPLATAVAGAVVASRRINEAVLSGGLLLTFVLCLATAGRKSATASCEAGEFAHTATVSHIGAVQRIRNLFCAGHITHSANTFDRLRSLIDNRQQ